MAACSPALCLLLCFVVCISIEAAHPQGDESCDDAAATESLNGDLHLLQVGLSLEAKRELESRLHSPTFATELESTRATALATLSKCSGQLSKNLPVVATLFDNKYAQLAQAWVTRMREHGYPALVIASLDRETFANMSSLFADDDHVCVVPFIAPPAHDASASLPTLAGLAKFDILATLSRLGHECLVSEGDVFLLRSPQDVLQTFDHTISIAGYPKSHNWGVSGLSRKGLNIGLVYARPTVEAASFLGDVAQKWSQALVEKTEQGQKWLADEAFFNKLLWQQPPGLWGLLGEELDCNKSVFAHLKNDCWRRSKVEIMRDLYAGVVTCRDIDLERLKTGGTDRIAHCEYHQT